MHLKEVALDYNAATDTMYVGVQTWGVAGNVVTRRSPTVDDFGGQRDGCRLRSAIGDL